MNEAGFLEAIRADPSDEDTWCVYADWLADQGDLRTEVLRILSTIGLLSNLEYYPDLQATMQELRELVDETWLDEMLELRKRLEQSTSMPSSEDIEDMWQELEITPIRTIASERPSALDDLVRALEHNFDHPEALFIQYALSPHPVLDWFSSRNRWDDLGFFQRFVHSAPVRLTCEPFEGRSWEQALREDGYAYTDASTFVEQMVLWLCDVGYYGSTRGSRKEARSLANRFCSAVFGNLAQVQLCHTAAHWGSWFSGICDRTWLFIDKATWRVSLLCSTDWGD